MGCWLCSTSLQREGLTQLATSKPQLASELVSNLGETVKEARKGRAQQAYGDLLTNIDALPLLVFYGSDGVKAEKALGAKILEGVQEAEPEPEPITNEHIEAASQYLRGTIVQGLVDNSTGVLSPTDTQLAKFHGIYQQDDRDIRDERQSQPRVSNLSMHS